MSDDPYLKISNVPVDKIGGAGPEPEEHPAKLITPLPADITAGKPAEIAGRKTRVVELAATIAQTGTAGQWANRARQLCRYCKHWDNAAWRKQVEQLKRGGTAGNDALNQLRGALIQTGNAEINRVSEGLSGDLEVEHAIKAFGVCHYLTDLDPTGEQTITFTSGYCPENVSNNFKPRSKKDAINAGKNHSDILKAAKK